MSNTMTRRQVTALLLSCVAALAGAGCRTAPPASAPSIDTPARQFDFLHMRLDVRLTSADIDQRQMSAVVTYRIRPSAGASLSSRQYLTLNAVGLNIQAVEELPGVRRLACGADAGRVVIALPRRLRPAEEAEIRITYSVRAPEQGLYFVLPDADHPERPRVVYTMSEPLLARHWLPCHDWPDTRWPSDIYISVPQPLTAVSVGVPVAEPVSGPDGLRTFHWRQELPIDPHMLGFVVGEFVTLQDTWRGRPVLAHVPPGLEAEARHTFRRVPEMLEYYSDLLGVAYPFPAYAHVVVAEHFHGGMEHVGFSMIAPSLLTSGHQGHVPESWSQYNYVAHMLAHQWFGGLVNYGQVREAWLNESFGTYLHLNWYTQTDGPDALADQMWRTLRSIAERDLAGRDHPLVRADLSRAGDVYNYDAAKVYWKGAWVLHMLRHQLGDAVFWEAVRGYLRRHWAGSVTTDDLRRAFEEVAGRDLKCFFDQWVWRGGVPRLAVHYAWDAARRCALVTIRQRQRIDDRSPAFVFPLDLWFLVDSGPRQYTLEVQAPEQSFDFDLPAEPQLFCVDPHGGLLAVRTEDKPRRMWQRQLRSGPTALARLQATEHLLARADDQDVALLAEVLRDQTEYVGVRTRAAGALGHTHTPAAQAALLAALDAADEPAEVRVAAIRQLGRWTCDESAYQAVAREIHPDGHILVREAAAQTLARFARELRQLSDVRLLAQQALPPISRHVRRAVMDALGQMADSRALDVLTASAAAQPDDPLELRAALIELVGRLAAGDAARRPTATAYLASQLEDPRPAVQTAALHALGEAGGEEALEQLARCSQRLSPSVRQVAEQTLEALERRLSAQPP